MDKRVVRNRVLRVTGVLLSAVLATWALFLLAPVPVENPAFGWKDVYPVLVDRTALPQSPEHMLAIDSDDQVISKYSSRITISAFYFQNQFPVAEIPQRIIPEDPRYDPYVQAVQNFFRSPSHPDWEVVYLKTSQPASSVREHLSDLQQNYPHGILYTSNRSMPRWVRPLVIVAGILLVLWGVSRTRRQRFWVFLAGVPLILTGNAGNPVVFCAMAASFLLWQPVFLRLIQRYRSSLHYEDAPLWSLSSTRLLVFAAVLLLANPLGILLIGGRPIPALVSLLGVLVMIGVSFLAWTWVHLLEQRRDHTIFMPLSLRPRSGREIAIPEAAPVFVVVVLGLVFAFLLGGSLGGLPGMQPLQLPQPVSQTEHCSLPELFQKVQSEEVDRSMYLPTLAEYLAHRSFQQSMLYGAEYGFPEPGQTINLMGSEREGSEMRTVAHTVVSYESGWDSAMLEDIHPDSIEAIMMEHGLSRTYQVGTVDSIFFDRGTIFWLLLLVLAALLADNPLPGGMKFFRRSRMPLAKAHEAA